MNFSEREPFFTPRALT